MKTHKLTPLLFTTLLSLLLSFPTLTVQQSKGNDNNPRLKNAYIALHTWKKAITSDPNNYTANWQGYDVCSYNGVYCAPAPDASHVQTVAGIDLNHANISGTLPNELGLLTDLALLHLNSNRFFGAIPSSFSHLKLLHELDLSNNLFCGPFPHPLLCLPSLKYLDIRYNHFTGSIPPSLFDLKLDALFLNNNNFSSSLPTNIANSPLSVLVLANNNLNGCFPNMPQTLQEIILINAGLTGCLPSSIGDLNQATVFDVSFNHLTGTLPQAMGKMQSLEQLNVAHNMFYGEVPKSICSLPNLQNFTYSYNYFCVESIQCSSLEEQDDTNNCLAYKPMQRSLQQCKAFLSHPPKCDSFGCPGFSPPPPPSPSPPPPPPPLHTYYPHNEHIPYDHKS